MLQPRAAVTLMALKSMDLMGGKVPRSGSVLKALLPTPWEILKQSMNSVTIRKRAEALRCAQSDCTDYNRRRLVLFSDASVKGGASAIAVSWRVGSGRNDWRSKHYGLPKDLSVEQSEFCAAIQAFRLAAQLCDVQHDASSPYDTIVVYTDATDAILRFCHPERYEEVDGFRDTLINQTKLQAMVDTFRRAEVKLELHWCPGHSGVVGNVLSDRVSYKARNLLKPQPGPADPLGLQSYVDAIADRAPHRLQGTVDSHALQKASTLQSTRSKKRRVKVKGQTRPNFFSRMGVWSLQLSAVGVVVSLFWPG